MKLPWMAEGREHGTRSKKTEVFLVDVERRDASGLRI